PVVVIVVHAACFQGAANRRARALVGVRVAVPGKHSVLLSSLGGESAKGRSPFRVIARPSAAGQGERLTHQSSARAGSAHSLAGFRCCPAGGVATLRIQPVVAHPCALEITACPTTITVTRQVSRHGPPCSC